MFGHRASTEPQRLWPCGDVAWANAGPANAASNLTSSEKYLGTGRRCL
jgi:hypothetical protein